MSHCPPPRALLSLGEKKKKRFHLGWRISHTSVVAVFLNHCHQQGSTKLHPSLLTIALHFSSRSAAPCSCKPFLYRLLLSCWHDAFLTSSLAKTTRYLCSLKQRPWRFFYYIFFFFFPNCAEKNALVLWAVLTARSWLNRRWING